MAFESDKLSQGGPCLVPQGSFSSKKALPLKRLATVVGSEDRCHLHLVSSSVSKHHAIIVCSPGEAYITDLGSRTKVLINGEEAREVDLSDGDRIQIGKFEFSFDGSGLKPSSKRGDLIPFSVWVDGRTILVTTRLIFIGRRPGADVHLSNENVSLCHAAIFQSDGKIYIRDMHSRTGTKVNGGRIHQEEIQIGDQIQIGESSLRLMPAVEDTPAIDWAEKIGVEMSEPETVVPGAAQHVIAVSADANDEVTAEPATIEPPSTQETAIPIVLEESVAQPVNEEPAPQPLSEEPPIKLVAEEPAIEPVVPATEVSEPVIAESVIPEPVIPESSASEVDELREPEQADSKLPRYRKTRAKIRRIPPSANADDEALLPSEEAVIPVEPSPSKLNEAPLPAQSTQPAQPTQPDEPIEIIQPPAPLAELPPLKLALEPLPPQEMEISLNLQPVSEAMPAVEPSIIEESLTELPISLESLNLDLLQSDHPAAPLESPTVAFPSDDFSIEFHDNEVPRPLIAPGLEIAPPEIQLPPQEPSEKREMLFLDEPLDEPRLHESQLAKPVSQQPEKSPLDKSPLDKSPLDKSPLEKSSLDQSDKLPEPEKAAVPQPVEVLPELIALEPELAQIVPEPVKVAPPQPVAIAPAAPTIVLPEPVAIVPEPVKVVTSQSSAPALEPVEVAKEPQISAAPAMPMEAAKNLEPIIPMSAMGNQTIVAMEHHLGGMPVFLPRAEVTPPEPVVEVKTVPVPVPAPEPLAQVKKAVEPPKILKPPRTQQAAPQQAPPPQKIAPQQPAPLKQAPPPRQISPVEAPKRAAPPAAAPIAAPKPIKPAAAAPPPPVLPIPQRTAFDGLSADPIGRDLLEAAAVAAAANAPLSSDEDSDEMSAPTFSTSVIPTPEDQTAAAAALTQPIKVTTAARRRKVIPFLMLTMILSMAASCAAVWGLVSVKSHVLGTLTFLNKSWVSGTDDGNLFESQQRNFLSPDQTRQHAIAVLGTDSPAVPPGFLASSEKYVAIVNTVALSSDTVNGIPQTTVKISAEGNDPAGDGFRMKAILKALIAANDPALDENRRLLKDAGQSAQNVEDIKKKLDQARFEIDAQNLIIDEQPTQQEVDRLTENKRKAQVALDHLNGQVDADQAQTQPGDGNLSKLRAQLATLKDQLQTAQDEQSAGISHARADLESAAKQFDDQLSSASAALDHNSRLKQFFDSAGQSQAEVRELISTLLVDGEDLEKQLEDVHREVNDTIQHRQEEKWAADTQLQDLLAQLGAVRRQSNALTSQGNADAKQLDELKKQESQWQAQVDARKAQLPVDPNEVRVSDGLAKLSISLKYKLQREREQIDQVLNPMEKQLADLDPDVAALPDSQQEVARQLHQRLDSLNQARKQYAQAIASDQQSPSDKILRLQKQIDDANSQLGQPQAESDSQMRDILQAALASASRDLQQQQKHADDAQTARGRLLDLGTQVKSLGDLLITATAARDAKAELASHAFDIRPLSDSDVSILSSDPRKDYCLYSVAGLALIFAVWTMVVSGSRESIPQGIQNTHPPQGTIAAIPIGESSRSQSRGQRHNSADESNSVFLDDESETMVAG